jgi:hypothetical protein
MTTPIPPLRVGKLVTGTPGLSWVCPSLTAYINKEYAEGARICNPLPPARAASPKVEVIADYPSRAALRFALG